MKLKIAHVLTDWAVRIGKCLLDKPASLQRMFLVLVLTPIVRLALILTKEFSEGK